MTGATEKYERERRERRLQDLLSRLRSEQRRRVREDVTDMSFAGSVIDRAG